MESPDGQKARSLTTQTSLMEAAEKLIAKNGIENVSIKQIVREAGQKNESALQYHFKNLKGLISAINFRRNEQTQVKREELIAELDSANTQPALRDLCRLMIMPTYLLAKADAKYRRHIIGFSHTIALAEESALVKVSSHGGGGKSGVRTGELLRAALPHLDEATYRQRMEFAVRMTSATMGHHARQKNAFKGTAADLFVSQLIDALDGLLSAPVSRETKANSKAS